MDTATGDAIMGALLRIKTHRSLHFLAAELRLRLRRLSFLLLSPIHFSLVLSHLRSLPLHRKTLLLARLLLRSLSLLFFPLHRIHCLRLRDFDAAILLLAMCDAYNPSAASTEHRSIDWRSLIARRFSGAALSTAGLGGGLWPVLLPHVDAAAKCHRLVQAARPAAYSNGCAAAAVAVTSLAVAKDGECAICGEMIAVGVALPCGHPFHWKCILEWLRMRNTCPFCRYQLPTDDVYTEIERVWSIAMKVPEIDQLNLC